MRRDTVQLSLEPLELGNIDGLGEQFADELGRVVECFNNPEGLDPKALKAKIKVEIELEYHPETGAVLLSARTGLTLPRRRMLARPLMLRNERLLIERDEDQAPLFVRDPESVSHRSRPIASVVSLPSGDAVE